MGKTAKIFIGLLLVVAVKCDLLPSSTIEHPNLSLLWATSRWGVVRDGVDFDMLVQLYPDCELLNEENVGEENLAKSKFMCTEYFDKKIVQNFRAICNVVTPDNKKLFYKGVVVGSDDTQISTFAKASTTYSFLTNEINAFMTPAFPVSLKQAQLVDFKAPFLDSSQMQSDLDNLIRETIGSSDTSSDGATATDLYIMQKFENASSKLIDTLTGWKEGRLNPEFFSDLLMTDKLPLCGNKRCYLDLALPYSCEESKDEKLDVPSFVFKFIVPRVSKTEFLVIGDPIDKSFDMELDCGSKSAVQDAPETFRCQTMYKYDKQLWIYSKNEKNESCAFDLIMEGSKDRIAPNEKDKYVLYNRNPSFCNTSALLDLSSYVTVDCQPKTAEKIEPECRVGSRGDGRQFAYCPTSTFAFNGTEYQCPNHVFSVLTSDSLPLTVGCNNQRSLSSDMYGPFPLGEGFFAPGKFLINPQELPFFDENAQPKLEKIALNELQQKYCLAE